MADDYDFLERALEKPKEAPKEEKRARTRSRSKSRDRDRRRDRDYRDKDGNRDRERDRDRDRDRERRRSRSRERRRSRSRERRPEPTREPPREYHSRRPVREVTPPEVRVQRERDKELKEMERATRTVFAYNLNLKAEERDIFKWFSQAGMVTDLQLITDKNTKKSKGIAYVEYSTQEGAITAITALNGQLFMSMPVMIKGSEVEKNLAWEAQQAAKQHAQHQHNEQATAALLMMAAPTAGLSIPSGLGSCRLLVNNLHPGLDEGDLKQAFEPFGFLETVEIARDANKRKQGHGFVQFREFTDGAKAIQHWNGRQLGGRPVEVLVAPPSSSSAPGLTSGTLLSGLHSAGPPSGSIQATESYAAAFLAQQGILGVINELDEADDEGKGGVKLDAQKRMALMQRLAATAGISGPAPSQVLQPTLAAAPAAAAAAATGTGSWDQGFLGPASPIPTPCLLLKNMFDAAEEEVRARDDGAVDPANAWVKEVEGDVSDECSRFGEVKHIFLDRDGGHVYVKFADQHGASAAHKALNGRFYSGKQIIVEFQFAQPYDSRFTLQ